MQKEYTHLSRFERDRIYQMQSRQSSIRAIARSIRRHPSTVSRELNRNYRTERVVWDSPFDTAKSCHEKALKRRSKKRPASILHYANGRAITATERSFITDCIQLRKYSAEDISMKLLREEGVELSGRTIRRWVKRHARYLLQHFPRKGRPYQSRLLGRSPKDRDKRSIHSRGAEANARLRIGHFEADCVVSSHNTWSLLVVEDRASSHTFVRKVANLQAETVRKALFQIFLSIPERARHTCTFDNGSEFSCYRSIERLLKIETYFCDAYKSWQKGGIENKNSRIRRYLPKGTNLNVVSDTQIAEIEFYLNDRPVQRLKGLSASELWNQQLHQLI